MLAGHPGRVGRRPPSPERRRRRRRRLPPDSPCSSSAVVALVGLVGLIGARRRRRRMDSCVGSGVLAALGVAAVVWSAPPPPRPRRPRRRRRRAPPASSRRPRGRPRARRCVLDLGPSVRAAVSASPAAGSAGRARRGPACSWPVARGARRGAAASSGATNSTPGAPRGACRPSLATDSGRGAALRRARGRLFARVGGYRRGLGGLAARCRLGRVCRLCRPAASAAVFFGGPCACLAGALAGGAGGLSSEPRQKSHVGWRLRRRLPGRPLLRRGRRLFVLAGSAASAGGPPSRRPCAGPGCEGSGGARRRGRRCRWRRSRLGGWWCGVGIEHVLGHSVLGLRARSSFGEPRPHRAVVAGPSGMSAKSASVRDRPGLAGRCVDAVVVSVARSAASGSPTIPPASSGPCATRTATGGRRGRDRRRSATRIGRRRVAQQG